MPCSFRLPRLLAAIVALGLLVSACGGERPTIEEGGASREVTVDDENPTTTRAPESEPVTVRLGVGDTWTGDPADAGPTAVANRVIAGLLHEGLTAVDGNGAIVPGLAERWFVSDDRLQWTFVLPEGLTDNLGATLTARDIKASLERLAARGPADQQVVALRAVDGWDAFVAGSSGGAAGIAAADDSTLVITLTTPFEPLGAVLADPAFGVTGTTDEGDVRTTGDYRYGDDGTLVAVDSDSAVPTVELVSTNGNGGALLASGDVDWAVLLPRDTNDMVPGDVIRQPLEVQTGIVVRLPDAGQRGAVLSALNGTELALELTNASVAISPGVAGSAADLPPAVTVHLPEGPLAALAGELSSQLERAGTEPEILVIAPDAFATAVLDGTAQIFPMVMAGSGFARSTIAGGWPGGPDDVFGTADDARAALLEALWAEPDPAQRTLLITAAESRLREERLWLPVANAEVRIGLSAEMAPLRVLADGTLDLSGF